MSTANSVVLDARVQFASVRNLFSLLNFFLPICTVLIKTKQKPLPLGRKTHPNSTYFLKILHLFSSQYLINVLPFPFPEKSLWLFWFHHEITPGIRNFVSTKVPFKTSRPVIPVTDQTSISSIFLYRKWIEAGVFNSLVVYSCICRELQHFTVWI